MAEPNKDTIYIDIDDEITGIIDKLKASPSKIVALVLPKRAAVFQSIVNMKLLKRAADDAKKHMVLITAEAGLLPLAGAAGVHVAKTLNSKPEIPSAPTFDDAPEEAVEDDDEEPEVTTATAGDQPVGKLAGLGAAAAAADGVETVELDDDDEPPEDADADDKPKKAPAVKAAGKKNKKLHVPNFERFRLWLVLGGLLLIILIFIFVFALNVLPKATVNISTDATNINASVTLNLDTTASSLNTTTTTLPAKVVSQQKTYTQSVPTTGTKNEGQQATGSVTMAATECSTDAPSDVPVGSGLSSSGQTYITQSDTSFSLIGTNNGHGCFTYHATANTSITAQSGGSAYNTSTNNASFTVSGRSDVSASGSASGGTDNNVQVVSPADITNAEGKISTTNTTIKQALENQLQQDGYYAIAATFSPGTPTTTTSANAGDAATTVTATEAVTYTMFGAHESDLNTVIDNSVDGQINTSKQSILSNGLSGAIFNVNTSAATTAQVLMSVTAVAGPQLNTTAIKQSVAGLKTADIKSQIETNPDVTGVTVKFSPFWVTSAPKNTSKITVNIAKPTKTASNANN